MARSTLSLWGNLRGRLIAASGGNDRTIRVWDLNKVGPPLGPPLQGHRRKVRSVAIGGLRERPSAGLCQQRQHRARVGRSSVARIFTQLFVGRDDSNVSRRYPLERCNYTRFRGIRQ